MTTASSSSTTNPQLREETETEAICRKWTYMIPRPNTNSSRFEAAVDTKKFFQVTGISQRATMQEHARRSSPNSVQRRDLQTNTDIMNVNQKDEITVSMFKDRTLPFYRIISYPNILFSLILKTFINIIYTFLFDPSDRRDLSVFPFTATALSIMILRYSSSDEEVSIIAISSSLAVLSRLIEINQSVCWNSASTALLCLAYNTSSAPLHR